MKQLYISLRKHFQFSLALLLAIPAGAQAQRFSSSNYLQTWAQSDVVVPFSVNAEGTKLPVRWGLDGAWRSEQNVRKGVNHIGKSDITLFRSAFQTNRTLVGDTALNSLAIDTIRLRCNLADIIGSSVDLVLTEDQEAGILSYYSNGTTANVDRWTKNIIENVKWIESNTNHKVVAISPFNEPDYGWGQGSISNFKEIAQLLHEDSVTKDIAVSAGNTLNDDQASTWYNYMKPYVEWGNTHQLAGTFDNFAAFWQEVTSDGNYPYGDELHNVGEAMIGANYGMQAGIWWGFDSRARGEFCHISNHGSRLAYAEYRDAWTAASVYRDDETGAVKAFLGGSERQANTSSYLFLSPDRDVYVDGEGPLRSFRAVYPGGTGYQNGQTNAERVYDIQSGSDVPSCAITAGKYKLMNRASRGLVAEYGTLSSGLTNISQVALAINATVPSYAIWEVAPVESTIGGDYSFYSITSSNDGKHLNVLDNSTYAGTTIIAYDAGNASNEQWYLEYAGNGYYYIRNRESGLYLKLGSNSRTNGTNILQADKLTGTNALLEQWRFMPVDAPIEINAPVAPETVTATAQSASIRVEWPASTSDDANSYMVVRASADGTDANTIARGITGTSFVDHTAQPDSAYIYKVKAVDYSGNISAATSSNEVTLPYTQTLVANWQFEDSLMDNTENLMDAVASNTVSYSDDHQSGNRALQLSSNYLALPYSVADHDAMTITLWAKWENSTSSWTRLFDFGNGTTQYMFLTPSTGSVMRFAIKNGGDEQQVDAQSKLSAGVWKHIAVTIGDGTVTLYVDGEVAGTSTGITIKPSDLHSVLNYIGRSQFNADPYFNGLIDDVRIYNYSLSQDEVKAVMGDLTNGIESVSSDATDQTDQPRWNAAGQRIQGHAKGLVIEKGKKYIER